jgi:hypothetical protein
MKKAGAVEMYLHGLLSTTEELIHSSLDLSVVQFPISTKLEWLMERQEFREVSLKASETGKPEDVKSVCRGCSTQTEIVAYVSLKLVYVSIMCLN